MKHIPTLKNYNACFYNSFIIFHQGEIILSITQARNRTGKKGSREETVSCRIIQSSLKSSYVLIDNLENGIDFFFNCDYISDAFNLATLSIITLILDVAINQAQISSESGHYTPKLSEKQ